MAAIYVKSFDITLNGVAKTLYVELSSDKIISLINHIKRLTQKITVDSLTISKGRFFIEGSYDGESFDFDEAFECALYLGGIARRAIYDMAETFGKDQSRVNGGYIMLSSSNLVDANDEILFSMTPGSNDIYSYTAFEYGGDLDNYIYVHDDADEVDTLYTIGETGVERYDGKRCNRIHFIKRVKAGHPMDEITLS